MTEPAVHHKHQDDVEQVRRDLTELPDLVAQLALFRAAGSTPPDPDHRSSGTSNPSRPPVNLAVLDLEDERAKRDADAARTDYDLDRRAGARRQGVLPTLASWVRLIDAELWEAGIEHLELGMEACSAVCTQAPVRARTIKAAGPCSDIGSHHWTTPTIVSECSAILTHLDWIAEQQWFRELRDDVKTMRRDVRQAIGDRDPLPLTCRRCGWEVVDEGSYFRCTGCGKSTGLLEAHREAERARPRPLSHCADQVGVSVRTLRKLIAEKKLKHVAAADSGKTLLYDVRDVTVAVASAKLLQRAE